MSSLILPSGTLTATGFADINLSALDIILNARRATIGAWWDPQVEFDNSGTGSASAADRLALRPLACGSSGYPVDYVAGVTGTFGGRPAFGLRQGSYLKDANGLIGAGDFSVVVPFRPRAASNRAIIGTAATGSTDYVMYRSDTKLEYRCGGTNGVSSATWASGSTMVVVVGYTHSTKILTVRVNGVAVGAITGAAAWNDRNLQVGCLGATAVTDGATQSDPTRIGITAFFAGLDLCAAANATVLAEVEGAFRTHYGV